METFQLTMTGCGMHERLQEFTVRSQTMFKITPQIIACNFSFKNLTSLKVLSECSALCQTLDLTDDDIDLLTKAMPRLESLAIGEEPCGSFADHLQKPLHHIPSVYAVNGPSNPLQPCALGLLGVFPCLEEPALGEVWRSLSSLAPLVKCFPPEVWGFQGKERKLASTPMSLEDVYPNRFLIVLQKSPTRSGMASISTAVRVKGSILLPEGRILQPFEFPASPYLLSIYFNFTLLMVPSFPISHHCCGPATTRHIFLSCHCSSRPH
jgi:hypothetical protein